MKSGVEIDLKVTEGQVVDRCNMVQNRDSWLNLVTMITKLQFL
jgi:hypothetical protein